MNLRRTSAAAEKSAPFPAFVRPLAAPALPLAILSVIALVAAEPRIPRVLALAARLFLAV